MLSCPVVSQVLLATFINKSVLMALWRIAISGSGCQVVFSLVLVVLSNPRSKAKINIVKLFLFVLRKIVSSSCYICQAPGAIINTSSLQSDCHQGKDLGQDSLTGALVFPPGPADQPPLAGLGGWWNLTQIILTGTNLSRHRIRTQLMRKLHRMLAFYRI